MYTKFSMILDMIELLNIGCTLIEIWNLKSEIWNLLVMEVIYIKPKRRNLPLKSVDDIVSNTHDWHL
jgi:hypothetical protein